MNENKRTPENSRIVGNFGEYALAFFLTKKRINVMRVDTVFFDLIAHDDSGKIFPKDTNVGISVKMRDTVGGTIPHTDFEKIKDYAKKWNIVPYMCHIQVHEEKEQKILEGYIFCAYDAEKFFNGTKRSYAISFSKLRKYTYADENSEFRKNNYFKWILEQKTR
jgi:hypothetical protein